MGRRKERYRGIGQHYEVTLIPDESGKKATAIAWRQNPIAGTMLIDPGAYCLLSSELDLDQETLWRAYGLGGGASILKVRISIPLSQQGRPSRRASRRRAPLHYGHRLPTRAGDTAPSARARLQRQLDEAAPYPGPPATLHDHISARARFMCACPPGPKVQERTSIRRSASMARPAKCAKLPCDLTRINSVCKRL